MALGIEVGLGPGHIVQNWDPGPLAKRGQSPSQFSAHFYCGQTAGWIKMPLGIEVGQPPPQKGAEPPIFGPRLLWPNGCMDQDALGRGPTEVGLGLRDVMLDEDPAPPPLNGHSLPPIFGQCPLWPNGWMD